MNKKDNSGLSNLQSGNTAAFESLFKQYYSPLVAFACKYVTDVDIAREIVQDFFVKFYEKRQSISIDTSVKSYLYRSIHNSCLNYINQKNIQSRHLKIVGEENYHWEDNLEDEIQSVELQQRIHEIVESLPSKCRTIFKMNRYEGIRNEDIARQLNLSKRTVETQISKALKILRSRLSDLLGVGLFLLFISKI